MRTAKPSYRLDLLKFLILVSLAIWLIGQGAAQLSYPWQWYRVPRFLFSTQEGTLIAGPLVQGLLVTLKISGLSLVLAFVFGLTTALMRLSGSPVARGLSRCYLEAIRNTPLLVQLFFIYFVMSPVLDISAFTSAVMALSLFEGAYASEIFRSGIVSIEKGQWEAAHSLGLSRWHTYRKVVLPQSIRRILPPLAGQGISLIKDSALVSTIAIYDLSMHAQAIIARTYLVFEIWLTVAAIYLIITFSLSMAVRALENRYSIRT